MENKKFDLVEVVDDKIVVSSLQIAKHFDKKHKHVLDAINVIISLAEKSAQWFYEDKYKDSSGKTNPMYLMNRDGFSLLVMRFKGIKALEWQIKYIEAFNAMEARLKLIEQQDLGIIAERIASKKVRRELTDIIKEEVPDTPNKKFMYKNYTDLGYKAIFGKNTKQLKTDKNLSKKDSLRDSFNEIEIKKVKALESILKGFIEMGLTYPEIKNIFSKKFISA